MSRAGVRTKCFSLLSEGIIMGIKRERGGGRGKGGRGGGREKQRNDAKKQVKKEQEVEEEEEEEDEEELEARASWGGRREAMKDVKVK